MYIYIYTYIAQKKILKMTKNLKKRITQREQEKQERKDQKEKLNGKKEMVLDMALSALQNMGGNIVKKEAETDSKEIANSQETIQKLDAYKDDESTKSIVLDLCDEIEDGNDICIDADKVNDDDIAIVRECAFGTKASRLCQEYKRLRMKYMDRMLFIKLIKSCKIIMK